MGFADLVSSEAVLANVKASGKKQALQEIGHKAAEAYGLDCSMVVNGLLDREKLGSTAMGSGVAIPHAIIAWLGALTALTGAGILLALVVGLQILAVFTHSGRVSPDGVLGRHTITLDEEGLREETEFNSSLHRWPGIRRPPIVTRRLVIVQIGPGMLHVIPAEAFASEESRREFVALLEQRRGGGGLG